jgi:hypothetical protein
MKFNKWTLGLAAVGVVSLAAVVQAEEKSNPVMTALGGTTISGYVDTAMTWRLGNNTDKQGNGGANLVPGTLSGNKADAFSLNVVGLTLEKALDEAEWSAGYKVEMIYGPDARAWNNSFNAVDTFGRASSDFSIKQAYVSLRAPLGNGLDFKVGSFDCPLGYESFESYKNPTWTRSYGFGLEASEMTGAQVSYKFNDIISATAVVANRGNSGINGAPARLGARVSETEKTYVGAITLTAPESLGFLAGSTLTAGIMDGLSGAQSDTVQLYAGGTLNTPLEGLKVGAAYDHIMTSDKGQSGTANYLNGTYAYTIAGYVTYQATEKMKLAVRGELAKGTAGTWYAIGASENDPKNELFALTTSVDYSLWENVISRVEFRWDHEMTGQNQNGANLGGPFGYDDNNNFVLALNIIYKF